MSRFPTSLVLAIVTLACAQSPAEVAGGTDVIRDGKALYEASCAECHGVDLRGTEAGPSFLSIVYEPDHHSDAAFLVAVRNGTPAHHWDFGDMEPVPGLDDADVAAIAAFVRQVQEEEGFEPYPPD